MADQGCRAVQRQVADDVTENDPGTGMGLE